MAVTNTGSPQGCVLSPLLFIVCTDSCRCEKKDSFLVKFSDDTALLSLLQGDMDDHGNALPAFVSWCDDNHLDLNVSKTKMIFDFRKKKSACTPCIIYDEAVEIVDSYKYLGTVFDCRLRWDVNTDVIVKKCQQRLYLLWKLRSFSIDNTILSLFYNSFIESVLTFSFICWFGNLSVHDRTSLNRIVNMCSKIIGITQKDLYSFWKQQVVRKASGIVIRPEHVLTIEFSLLPSGRRYSVPTCKTNRQKFIYSFCHSFFE